MKFLFCFFFLVLSSFCGIAQNKGNLPPKQQKMPDKDPVVVIDNIEIGHTKTYHWHTDKLVATASTPTKATFSILHKGKTPPTVYNLAPNEKTIKVKLAKGINTIVIATVKTTKDDNNKVHITMNEKEMTYEITARLKTGVNDTLFINRH